MVAAFGRNAPANITAARTAMAEAAAAAGMDQAGARVLQSAEVEVWKQGGGWITVILADGTTIVQNAAGRILFLFKP